MLIKKANKGRTATKRIINLAVSKLMIDAAGKNYRLICKPIAWKI